MNNTSTSASSYSAAKSSTQRGEAACAKIHPVESNVDILLQMIRDLPPKTTNNNNKKPYVIAIEGNIGIGKSTFLRQFEQTVEIWGLQEQICCMQEPVDLWSKIQDPDTNETILSKFYKDVPKYAFAFQIMAYTSRLEGFRRLMREHPRCQVIVCERSLEADYHIFAKMLHDDGSIEPIQFQVYEMLFQSTSQEFAVDYVTYLDGSPELCAERIVLRGREGEAAIGLSYLQKCKAYYDAWITPPTSSPPFMCISRDPSIHVYDMSSSSSII